MRDSLLGTLSTGIFVGAMYLNVACTAVGVWRYLVAGPSDPVLLMLVLLGLLASFTPLTWTTGPASQAFIRWVCGHAGRYFSMKVILEGERLCHLPVETQCKGGTGPHDR